MYRYFFLSILVLLLAARTVHAAGEKLLLVGSGEPDPKDILLVDYLEEWGYEIEPREHLAKHPGNLAGIDFVFISESTSSANILDAYEDSAIPVVNAETWTYDDMGFAPDGTFKLRCGRRFDYCQQRPTPSPKVLRIKSQSANPRYPL